MIIIRFTEALIRLKPNSYEPTTLCKTHCFPPWLPSFKKRKSTSSNMGEPAYCVYRVNMSVYMWYAICALYRQLKWIWVTDSRGGETKSLFPPALLQSMCIQYTVQWKVRYPLDTCISCLRIWKYKKYIQPTIAAHERDWNHGGVELLAGGETPEARKNIVPDISRLHRIGQ